MNTADTGWEKELKYLTHPDRDGILRGRFQNIRQRCTNPKMKSYKNYGGRGIKLLWDSYEEFERDMLSGYIEHLKEHGPTNTTLDCIDNDGPYSKENCRWATRLEQNNNTRWNRMVTIDGETNSVEVWSRHYGIDPMTVYSRQASGMDWKEAFTKPRRLMGEEFTDSLYEDAVREIWAANYCSHNFLQQKLKTGFNQVKRLLVLLEERGVIGPFQGKKPREVLESALTHQKQ